MKVKLLITGLFCFMNGLTLMAQHNSPCAFDKLYQQNAEKYNAANDLLLRSSTNNFGKSIDSVIKIIPIVVHIIHNGGIENISDAQIQSQIDVLNEDFGKKPGTKGDGAGVDTRIRFCLAKLTPEGRCTDGIVRIKSTLADHKTVDRNKLKELSSWDNKRYLNVYIVKSIDNGSGTLGYSSFPGGPDESDGIVVLFNAFGRIGTVTSPYNLGRTTSHEISHWFGLYHTFQNGCGIDVCTDGDYVCDTPPVKNPNFGCPANKNSCSNDSPDLPDLIKNYTDYTDDACKNMFTAGQRDRIHNTLALIRQQIWSDSNITATGCDTDFVNGPCTVIADFTANSLNVCTGNAVLFTSKSLNKPITYQWYFPGGMPDTSSEQNPTVVYSTPGAYSARLIAADSTVSDTLFIADYITVSNPPIGQVLPFTEDFENANFPNNGIIIDNPDNGITWEKDTIALAFEGKASAKINNLININYGQSDALVLPAFDFSTYPGIPYLRFRWAYARSDANYSDQLTVLVSKDCGVNFAQVFTRSGNGLATGPTQTTPYIPDSNTVWKEAKINLSSYQYDKNVIIKIVNVTDGGNNLYIDDVKINDLGTGIGEQNEKETEIQLYPNPAAGSTTITYNVENPSSVLIAIYDMLGREVKRINEGSKAVGRHSIVISLAELPVSTIYMVKVTIGTRLLVKKLIIEHK